MNKICLSLLLITILLTTNVAKPDDFNSEEITKTYVGPLEKSLQIFIKSEQTINQKLSNIFGSKSRKKKSRITEVLGPFKSKVKAIFPGTYWCGDGNISPNGNDLSIFERTDACCRAHDFCPNNIAVEESLEGLVNNGIFTRSACECDLEFYQCLKEANNIIASNIGTTYFNVLRPQCFRKYYPIQGCEKRAGRRPLNDKCEEYVYDFTLPQKMQWFDTPDF